MGTYHKNSLPIGYQLAEYTIESMLGHGGFGITYLARDSALGALVAIKEFFPSEIAQRDSEMKVLPNPERQAVRDYQAGLKNFVKEARALAHFKHPHIVRVLRFLEANGTAYTVMEYEEGQSLADYLKRNGPRIDEQMILRVFIPILNGLHAVHDAKMMHLDIKPENIYLRKDGSPLLIDFGSARRAMTETKHVQRIALTHGYAPIEQYPDKGTPGPWTDVYAVGASMYRCISGKRPEDALTRYQALLKYQADPLTPASKIGAKYYQPKLLDCIDWALQIYGKDRPQSAREMQDGLMGRRRQSASQNMTRVNPFTPPRPATGARAMKRQSHSFRHTLRTIVNTGRVLITMALIAAALIGASVYWEQIETWVAAAREGITRPMPTTTVPDTRQRPEPAASSEPVVSSPKSPPPVPSVTADVPAPTAFARSLTGHQDWIQTIGFSADSKWLASGSADRNIAVWDVASGAVLGTLHGHEGTVNALAYSADGKLLASTSDDGTVRLWDGYTGGERGVLRGSGGALFALAIAPDGKAVAAGGRDQTIHVWSTDSGSQLTSLEGHGGDVFALAFSPDGRTLASSGKDKTIRFWNPLTGTERAKLTGHKDPVLALAFSPDGRWLASGDAGQTVRIWDAKTLTQARTLNSVGNSILSLDFSPDGHWLAAGTADGKIVLLEGEERRAAHTLSGHAGYVQSVAFSPDGRLLASGSRDRSVRLWTAAN